MKTGLLNCASLQQDQKEYYSPNRSCLNRCQIPAVEHGDGGDDAGVDRPAYAVGSFYLNRPSCEHDCVLTAFE